MSIRDTLDWRPHPILRIPTDQDIIDAKMTPEQLVDVHRRYHEVIQLEKEDPYRNGFELDTWVRADNNLAECSELHIYGGNRCLAPEQKIYDPIKGVHVEISKIDQESHVLSWNGSHLVVAKASKPFRKTLEKIYRVTLEDGSSFSCSGEHRVLLANGEFQHIRNVEPQALLYRPQTISDTVPLKSWPDGQSFLRTPQDFPKRCFAYSHQYDE